MPKEVTATTKDGKRTPLNPLWSRRQSTKFNGVSYVSQRAAEAIYTADGHAEIRKTIDYYMENARLMRATLQNLGYKVYGGKDAPYLWVRTPDGTTSWGFFNAMLQRAHVVCTPGVGFGPAGEGYVRLTAFGQHDSTEKALERIKTKI